MGKVQLNKKKLAKKKTQLLKGELWKKTVKVKRWEGISSLLIDLLGQLTKATLKGKEELVLEKKVVCWSKPLVC